MGCIYLCRNTVNGKCYIGKTVRSLQKRKSWHRTVALSGKGWAIHRAIRKYGFESFEWETLCECDDSNHLLRLEKEYIREHNTKKPHGYNLTEGGDGVTGRTPEAMARIVAFHTGRKRSEETRRRLSIAMTGKQIRLGARLSENTKRKISASLMGAKLSEEHKAKIGQAMAGKPKTLEQRAKMSEARKRWWAKKAAKAEQASKAELLLEV